MQRIIASIFVLTATALITGCTTPQVRYLDPASNDDKIVRVGKIDQQDWGMMASKLIDSLLASGVLKKEDGTSVVSIGRIDNKTSEHIETDLLVRRIRVAILRSGKAQVSTAVSAGDPEDPASMRQRKELRKNEEFEQSNVAKKGTMKAPDYNLQGTIIQSDAKAGRIRQSTFSFSMVLTDVKTGVAIWEDFREIVKQGNAKGAVGF